MLFHCRKESTEDLFLGPLARLCSILEALVGAETQDPAPKRESCTVAVGLFVVIHAPAATGVGGSGFHFADFG